MDKYTKNTKIWLDERFKKSDSYGIYFAHQPIYGFRKGHSEPGLIEKYIRTFQIMKILSHMKFNTLLDVGGAEGYKAYIIRNIFNANVKNGDLSEEACKRAMEIFHIDSDPVDIHHLPYKDRQFDVVLCSETLEHVTNFYKAINELLRVARKAVIITAPHDPEKSIEDNFKKQIPHGHIHNFNLSSFDFLKKRYHLIKKKMISPLLNIPSYLIEPIFREYQGGKLKNIIIDVYHFSIPILKRLFGKKIAGFLIRLDEFVCKFLPFYNAILIIILKKAEILVNKQTQKISPFRIINIEVPYYFIQKVLE